MKVDIDTSDKLYANAWLGFKGTDWKDEINVRDLFNITIRHMKVMNLSSPKRHLPPRHCGKR